MPAEKWDGSAVLLARSTSPVRSRSERSPLSATPATEKSSSWSKEPNGRALRCSASRIWPVSGLFDARGSPADVRHHSRHPRHDLGDHRRRCLRYRGRDAARNSRCDRRSARHGAIVKGGLYIETLARVKTVVLDKTGTLTFGGAEVRGVYPNRDAGVSEWRCWTPRLPSHAPNTRWARRSSSTHGPRHARSRSQTNSTAHLGAA